MKKLLVLSLALSFLVIMCSFEPYNIAPNLEDILARPSTVIAGEICTLEAVATDEDGDDLSYEWSVAKGDLADKNAAITEWTTPLTAGLYWVTCVISDGKNEAYRTIHVEVYIPQ